MTPKLSVLIASRKDSKYLAKFLTGYFANTIDVQDYEVLVMLNANDTWNKELVEVFKDRVQFYYEDLGLGRAGLNTYFNMLLEHSKAPWVVYFCEDHFINVEAWDHYVFSIIGGGTRSINDIYSEPVNEPLDPKKPWVIVPKFDNAGAMNHILSRGFIDAIGGIGKHGWIDSYINDVNHQAFKLRIDRSRQTPGAPVILMDDEIFHDFTHDDPHPMDEANNFTPLSAEGRAIPKYDSPEVLAFIEADAKKLRLAMEGTAT